MGIYVIVKGEVTTAKIPARWLKHYQLARYEGRCEVYRALPSHPYYSFYV
jgi:hypothetical protein